MSVDHETLREIWRAIQDDDATLEDVIERFGQDENEDDYGYVLLHWYYDIRKCGEWECTERIDKDVWETVKRVWPGYIYVMASSGHAEVECSMDEALNDVVYGHSNIISTECALDNHPQYNASVEFDGGPLSDALSEFFSDETLWPEIRDEWMEKQEGSEDEKKAAFNAFLAKLRSKVSACSHHDHGGLEFVLPGKKRALSDSDDDADNNSGKRQKIEEGDA